ncbi:TPA: NirD/YgiW/YdeI family stress tolerance protein [Vibrio alginolyticus]|uniref:YgiW/YdeI family stress tolerance OB fold protein n=1 Tax=Vibrio alginolyticus TaxID=663 RepID=UPI001BD43752|nr:NirD/YgiW/YdeI family stress tolerance protein [Vibrio alginolyticus]EGQ8038614.1 NirD/YgiW/YdeI family stress tolerance protein [Vibrio alginolyticus]ELB2760553.1 NirD/YgiW/YdeI family stress tolerance protein [Vibrio alginolyticus]MBS9904368.1 NirD/YgiW/YdeI family stress tolerance protein [Vibrio alginolyticus]MBS9931803.1 NirD/YgiW/YdeI family stress tolerance protein [Vibrio alginolyticus]MBS9981991.1 NirD/YgiW/YdeI family stress tolerance protein [Vibrio alginolyticus]
MKKNTIIATIAALAIAPSIAFAKDNAQNQSNLQFNGPVTVEKLDALLNDSNMFTEKDVVVEGNLLRQVRADKFIFSDGSGEVMVELDDDIQLNTPIDHKTKVRLFGEFEGGNKPEIEVEQLVVM